MAHKYLDGLFGIEIGASAHNPFGLNTVNVDCSLESGFKKREIELCGRSARVDVIGDGLRLPFGRDSVDFVLSSHVIEHIGKPAEALLDWNRIARRYIFVICPHFERTFDRDRRLSTLEEVLAGTEEGGRSHHFVWNTELFVSLCRKIGLRVLESHDRDDKVGNGFMVLIETEKNKC